MWQVSSRSGVATLRTAIHLLLTYLLTIQTVPIKRRAKHFRSSNNNAVANWPHNRHHMRCTASRLHARVSISAGTMPSIRPMLLEAVYELKDQRNIRWHCIIKQSRRQRQARTESGEERNWDFRATASKRRVTASASFVECI